MTNVTVATTVTLMIPVQSATVDEPHDSRERDLLARDHDDTDAAPASRLLNPLASTNDFGQPAADPNPMNEPSWQQICAMGYEIPGIGVIGGDIVAGILERFDTKVARVLLDERTGILIETGINAYLPNPAMRRFIHKRDTHCRFPGCQRNAKRTRRLTGQPDNVDGLSQR